MDSASSIQAFSESTVDRKEEEENDDDDKFARAIHLYCRLYYRKGPWFRLDDVYSRYYGPKQKACPLHAVASSSMDSAGNNKENEELSSSQEEREAKAKFFQPRVASKKPLSVAPSESQVVDQALLQKHTDAVLQLLQDLQHLFRTGLLRSFADETECGKTVGIALLTADERATVLSKLGGGKKRPPPNRSQPVEKGEKQATKQQHAKVIENEIWKQMSRQRSVIFNQANDATVVTASSPNLPVRAHVANVLVDKLVTLILQSCSRVAYIPAPIVRSCAASIKASLRSALQQLSLDLGDCICFRMREAPVKTLRRCARLYLCATSGPGDMRGDGTNGWRSLLDIPTTTLQLPLSRMVPPPGLTSWTGVVYPGLSYRFGLSSCVFLESFQFLPVQHGGATEGASEQVFADKAEFRAWEQCVEIRAHVDYLIELNELIRYEGRKRQRMEHNNPSVLDELLFDSVDFLGLLTPVGRRRILDGLTPCLRLSSQQRDDLYLQVHRKVEEIVPTFGNECEKIISVVGILIMEVLAMRHKVVSQAELTSLIRRPWLRHLRWDGCLVYVLWDVIPILERNGNYLHAAQSLEVILFGQMSLNNDEGLSWTDMQKISSLAPLLLSRRARGKAYDRLIIDRNHLARQVKKAKENISTNLKYIESLISNASHSSTISFSAIRILARRLKQPLEETMKPLFCLEAQELGLRFANTDLGASSVPGPVKKGYSDWTPTTDRTVANSLGGDEKTAGSRCAYVGHEESENNALDPSSLNVEELAMEYYRTGRLPAESGPENEISRSKGGWVGWHDEGGHLRTLFRILCSAEVLKMDWGCRDSSFDSDDTTVHLLPYQSAPFDLHVGFELLQDHHDCNIHPAPSRGFYYRRQRNIHDFLSRMAQLSRQQICDLVHESVSARVRFMNERKRKDPYVERDIVQLRTLSFMAAGCGGELLAAAFRCLFFDYRHYSGGLPDLTLVRATYDDGSNELVDLGGWVGESFDHEFQESLKEQQGTRFLSDKDDEFLGCSKLGDSGSLSSRSNAGRRPTLVDTRTIDTAKETNGKFPSLENLPQRLELVHNGRPILPECMMVEVKSSNDRLDPRQEDWLNILDRYGNARVCKFEATSTRSGKKKKSAMLSQTASTWIDSTFGLDCGLEPWCRPNVHT